MEEISNNQATLNELRNEMPNLLKGVDFHNSLERCLANVFQISTNQENIKDNEINTTIYSYCLKPNRQNTDYCYKSLAEILFDQIIQYTIPRREREAALATGNTAYVNELQRKAKRKYIDYWKKRDDIVQKEKLEEKDSITKSGEGGEELLFLLAEQVLGLPQAFCKMNLKTSYSMHFHGADGIHIGLTEDSSKLALYYSEVKVYKDVNVAIKNCLESLAPILKKEEKEQCELDLLSSHLDIGNNEKLANKLKEYFNPNRVECCEFTEIRGLCLIAFNESGYEGFDYDKNAYNIMPETKKWIAKFKKEKIDNNIKNVLINVFFIPMTCIDTFRNSFKKCIRGTNE